MPANAFTLYIYCLHYKPTNGYSDNVRLSKFYLKALKNSLDFLLISQKFFQCLLRNTLKLELIFVNFFQHSSELS